MTLLGPKPIELRDVALTLRVTEFDPAALAAAAGVLAPADRPCKVHFVSKTAGSRFCCRSEHSDPWHIDGRWPTTPWTCDGFGRLTAEVSR